MFFCVCERSNNYTHTEVKGTHMGMLYTTPVTPFGSPEKLALIFALSLSEATSVSNIRIDVFLAEE